MAQPDRLKEVEKTLTKRARRVSAFLNSPNGVSFLDVLRDEFGNVDTFDKDPYAHAYKAGARSVILWIEDMEKRGNYSVSEGS